MVGLAQKLPHVTRMSCFDVPKAAGSLPPNLIDLRVCWTGTGPTSFWDSAALKSLAHLRRLELDNCPLLRPEQLPAGLEVVALTMHPCLCLLCP